MKIEVIVFKCPVIRRRHPRGCLRDFKKCRSPVATALWAVCSRGKDSADKYRPQAGGYNRQLRAEDDYGLSRTDEQDWPLFLGDTAFALQADRKSLYMFSFLDRFEASLRNTILIYTNDACADWILVLRVDRP